MSNANAWASVLQAMLARRDPKTPLSFYTRFVWVVVVGVGGLSFNDLSIDAPTRAWLIGGCLSLGVGVVAWVGVLNWCRPENLLYGADAHLEKWKISYGTDQGTAAESDLANLKKAGRE